jgi:hypothetical protein
LIAFVLLLLTGCHATLPDPASLAQRPDDFVLSATVFTATPPEPGAPRARRPARYIVEADETLRAATGQGAGRDTFPPPTRTLTAGQMESLWVVLRESGLLEPGNRYLLDSPARAATDPVAAAIDIAYRGARAHLLVPLDGADAESIAAERLVDELAALSWIE